MASSDEERLHRAVWAYHDALQRRDGVEARLRRGETDLDLTERSLRSADAVTTARLDLYRLLVEEGWTAPERLAREMEQDVALLHQESS